MPGRPRGSGQRTGIPVCPRRATSHVVRHGKYGKQGERRQLYQCQPNGGATHTFAGTLARKMLEYGAGCDTCETHLETYQGPPTPTRFDFTVREAATTLNEVARGASYSEAAAAAWANSGRQFVEDRRQPQLAANWVETLTPIVTAPFAETSWPETIVCDSTNYQSWDAEVDANRQSFAILAVWGYEAGGQRGRLWALHATHTAKGPDWVRLFDQLPGVPDLVVCDGAEAIKNGVAMKWPEVTRRTNWSPAGAEPFVLRCEYHLRANALKFIKRQHLASEDEVLEKLDKAFGSPQGWAAFRRKVANYPDVIDWCDREDAQIRSQTAWRSRLPAHHSNGAVEAAIATVKGIIDPRAAVLRNKYRTNQMLELVRTHINKNANATDFARTLRTSLEAGATVLPQLSCVDVGTRTREINGVMVRPNQRSSLRR
jgi:hypothetical protein